MVNTIKKLKEYKNNIKLKKGEQGYKMNQDGDAIINVGAENYDDIFSPYCYKGGDSIRSDLVGYIEEKAACVPLETELEIIFRVQNATEAKRIEIEEAMRENYENKIREIDQRLQRNTSFALSILFIGIVFFAVYILTHSIMPFAIQSIFEIAAWVFIWEALDAFFLDRRLLQLQKLIRYRLLHSKISIKEFESY